MNVKYFPNADGANEILPSTMRVQPRQPRKARKRTPDEPANPYKINCSEYVVTYGNSGSQDHNFRDCSLPENPNIKRWHPKKKKEKKKRKVTITSSNVA
jgi:hypothetical protein